MNLIAGLVLLGGALRVVPVMGKHLVKLSQWLGGFQTIIGIIALLLGLLGILGVI